LEGEAGGLREKERERERKREGETTTVALDAIKHRK
jgi:hypothetical protein